MAGTVGNITYVAQIINIDNDKLMARESVAETLLHEIIHIIDEELSLKMGEDNVGRMSVSIYSLLRDNPNLWKVFKNA
jgi:DNA-directed RNA polymerase alpha subunit